MTVDEAFALVSRAVDSGRAANGYLVCGDLRGQCDALAERVLAKLFPDETDKIAANCHPDVFRLEPQGKSRRIKVERGKDDDGPGMRDGLVGPVAATSFSGGWKAGVIVSAERMMPEAANAFLKTLEEPPPKTLFLLLTDQPDAILPTIVSRTQRIDLPLSDGVLEGGDYDAVAEVFESRGVSGPYAKVQAGMRLAEILGAVKDAAEDEETALVRKSFYRTVMRFVRGWMVEGLLPYRQAFRNVEAVEDAFRRSEMYLPDETVLCYMAERIVWPPGRA